MYTKFATNSLKAFHALYIGTWAVTAKREPLSISRSLIITTCLLRFLLGPTCLSVSRPLSTPPRSFILGCPLCFVCSSLAFHTWSSKAANNLHHECIMICHVVVVAKMTHYVFLSGGATWCSWCPHDRYIQFTILTFQ